MAGRWKRYGMIAGWWIALGAFVSGMFFGVVHGGANTWDFAIYLTAANALRHNPHAAIYSLSTIAATHSSYGGCAPVPHWGYLYQPLFAIILEPLTYLPCSAAAALWDVLNVAVMLACIIWLARRMGKRHGAGAILATVALCLLSVPLYNGLYYGQVHIITLGLCLAAASLMRRNHPRWAGATLAVGTFLKYLPALLLVYYLVRRQWAAAVGAAIVTPILALFELAIVGPATLRMSLSGGSGDLLSTLSMSMTATTPNEPYILSFLVIGACTVAYIVLLLRKRDNDTSDLGLSLGEAWAIGAMTFASPVVWYHYFTWLLPLSVVLLDTLWTMRARRARYWKLAGLIVLFAIAFVNVPSPSAVIAGVILWLIVTGMLLTKISLPVLSERRSPESIVVSASSR